MKVKVAQSRLCNPMDYTVRGILQTRILEWASFPFSRESSQLRDRTCQGTFNFKGSYMLFSSFVCHSLRTLCSLSIPGKQEWAELHTVLRTEIMRKGTCLDSFQWHPSVTFYLKVIYSVMSHLLRIWNAFWPFEDCYLLDCFCLICLLPCMKIYKHVFLQIKHPCFTRDLGPLHPSSRRLQSPGPSLWRPWYEPKSPTLQVEAHLFFILSSSIHFNWSVFI